jgi:hypothetical protein
MRATLAFAPLVGCLVLLASGVIPVDASIRQSFSLDSCTWNATHIVLVQTTAKDGLFSVVESWKGDLKPGEPLEVPELRPDENAVPISNYKIGISERIPRQPGGSRMILFLKRRGEGGAASPSEAIGTGMQWEPASAWGGIKVSALWIDGGKAFCFQQQEYPGPSALSACSQWPATLSSDVAVFTVRIQEVLQVQRNLAETLALKNVDVRAQRLGWIALGDVCEGQKEAIEALGKAGTVALPEVLQVMDRPPVRFYDGSQLIRVFVEAAGKDSGRQLQARLQQDLIYWKAVGPTLTQNWLEQLGAPGSSLFVKFNETVLLIRELDQEHYTPAAQTVAELRDFWVSQPQLYDPKWGERDLRNGGTGLEMIRAESFELAKQCDDFVKHAEAKKVTSE